MFKKKTNSKSDNPLDRKIKPLEMYTDLLRRRLQSNSRKLDVNITTDDKVIIGYDKIITKSSIRKYYVIESFSDEMPKDLITILRQIEIGESSITDSSGNTVKIKESVSVNFKINLESHIIDWSSKEMRSRASAWENTIKEGDANIERHNLKSNQELQYDKATNWLKKSWEYWLRASGDGCSTPVMTMLIELCVNRSTSDSSRELDALYTAEQKLYALCTSRGLGLKNIKGNLWDFSLLFSPVSSGNPTLYNDMPRFPITDEIVAEITDYTPGKLSDVEIPIGYDIDTGKAVYKNFVGKFGEAECILVAGITGSGKSYMTKSLTSNVLAAGYSVVVMDRDGEYIPLANHFGGVVISMSAGSGLYYDSTEIANLTGDTLTDAGLLDESVTTTITLFDALVSNNDEHLTNIQRAILNDAYNDMFNDYGIDRKDKYTWCNSSNLSFKILYRYICKKRDDKDYYLKYSDSLDMLIDALRIYFEDDGIYSYLFKNRVSITKIQRKLDGDCPLIVLHMDLKDESADGHMDKPSLLKLITTNYLSNVILLYNKSKGAFTFDIVEEFQRYLNNTYAKGITTTKITGNRKRNAITLVVTNSPIELATTLESDPALKAIGSNITTSIIGKINNYEQIDPICRNLGLANCQDEYKKMLDKPDLYKHVFIARIDGREAALIKAIVPPSLANSNVFLTRDTKRRM